MSGVALNGQRPANQFARAAKELMDSGFHLQSNGQTAFAVATTGCTVGMAVAVAVATAGCTVGMAVAVAIIGCIGMAVAVAVIGCIGMAVAVAVIGCIGIAVAVAVIGCMGIAVAVAAPMTTGLATEPPGTCGICAISFFLNRGSAPAQRNPHTCATSTHPLSMGK